MTRPREISRYLFTMAATISEPPELPLYDRPNAKPTPQNTAPMMADMKGCPCKSIGCGKAEPNTRVRIVRITTP